MFSVFFVIKFLCLYKHTSQFLCIQNYDWTQNSAHTIMFYLIRSFLLRLFPRSALQIVSNFVCIFTPCMYARPLWSSGQSSWLHIQRSGFDSRRYKIFWEVVGLERGPLSLVNTTEELLERKSSVSGLENQDYDRRRSASLATRHPSIHTNWH
jgi:hypothetical protein